jgi:hypothetical protein
VRWVLAYARQSVEWPPPVPAVRSGSRGWTRRVDERALDTCALIATFRCAAPGRCGAFGDERRVVGGDEGGRAGAKRSSDPLGAVRLSKWVLGAGFSRTRFTRSSGRQRLKVREAGARTDSAPSSHRRAHRHLPPPSIVMRPRVAARSPMSGASCRETKAAECGRERLIESHRALRLSSGCEAAMDD